METLFEKFEGLKKDLQALEALAESRQKVLTERAHELAVALGLHPGREHWNILVRVVEGTRKADQENANIVRRLTEQLDRMNVFKGSSFWARIELMGNFINNLGNERERVSKARGKGVVSSFDLGKMLWETVSGRTRWEAVSETTRIEYADNAEYMYMLGWHASPACRGNCTEFHQDLERQAEARAKEWHEVQSCGPKKDCKICNACLRKQNEELLADRTLLLNVYKAAKTYERIENDAIGVNPLIPDEVAALIALCRHVSAYDHFTQKGLPERSTRDEELRKEFTEDVVERLGIEKGTTWESAMVTIDSWRKSRDTYSKEFKELQAALTKNIERSRELEEAVQAPSSSMMFNVMSDIRARANMLVGEVNAFTAQLSWKEKHDKLLEQRSKLDVLLDGAGIPQAEGVHGRVLKLLERFKDQQEKQQPVKDPIHPQRVIGEIGGRGGFETGR